MNQPATAAIERLASSESFNSRGQHPDLAELKGVSISRALRERASLCVLRKDRKGRIQFADETFCNSLGKSLDELIDKSDFDLFPPKVAQTSVGRDQAVMESGQSEHAVEEHHTTDGRRLYNEVLRIPVFNDQGNVVGIEVISWDVTDRTKIEAESEQARFLLDTMLDNIPDAVYFKDKKSRFIRISRAHARMFELMDPAEAIGKTDADFFGDEHAQGALADERRIMETGEPMIAQVERETWADREDTWCSTTKVPLRDMSGEIIGTFGISRNVTEQMRAELELARERDLLKTITHNIPDLIYVKDRYGRFVTCNAALLKLLGLETVDQLVGKTDYDFSPPEMACNYVADDQIVMRSGQPLVDQEESSQHTDGSRLWLLTTKVPLFGEDGSVTGMVGIGRDITARKKAAEELLAAKDAADAANRAKSEFLANMSHEIRTPMNGIMGMTELLSATPLTSEQSEFLGLVQQSAESLLRLLNDILDFSKIEAGRLELEEIGFNLRDCIGKAVKLLTLKADEKGLELAGRIDPAIPNELIGDPGRLRQIIVNFVGNAIKFTERGEVVVDVNPDELTADSAVLHVTVRDTGIGIAKEKQNQIFEAFSQADASTTRRFGGTGLGLTISARLIEMMGGRVWVESEPGVGTTFHFLVRLGVSLDQTPRRPAELSKLAGTRVLVVDDNSTNRRILQEILTLWHMQPVLAESGSLALEAAVQANCDGDPFGLVLLDYHMPEMDGLEFAEQLKEREDLQHGPIVMLSSSVSGLDPPRLRKCGVARYMTKPIIASELLDAVLGVMGVAKSKGTAKPVVPESPRQQRRKILLVEDGLVNQRVAMGFLKKWGHEITLAVNGREAIEALDRESFDLVLMDIQMPEMNGYEATAAIREREAGTGEHQFIVAMTAEAMKGDREKCLDTGMDDYISKPFDPSDLQRVIAASPARLLSNDTDSSVSDSSVSDSSVSDSSVSDSSVTRASDADSSESESNDTRPSASSSSASSSSASSSSASSSSASTSRASNRDQPDEPLYNWAQTLAQTGGDEQMARELALAYIEEAPRLISQMRSAIATRDAKLLCRSAHTLKGASGYIGAIRVVEAAKALEGHGLRGDLAEAASSLDDLGQTSERLVEVLKNQVAG